ncbi:MAG: hypothetical protein LC753_04955 [Acidobacteria bacterium]|nr:hypothetical protein [Acidobacteriota bacterium]MCA1649645.1 hypothetical protein [Acidobacteriota bacterium]
MNFPRVALGAVAVWILSFGFGFLVHAVLLEEVYLQHMPMLRPQAQASAIMPVAYGFSLIGFLAFSYAYAKGYEGGNGLQEGLRFGVLVGIMLSTFGAIWEYMVWPASTRLLAAWLIDFIVEFAVYGMVVGLIYKPTGAAVRRVATI